MMAKRLSAVVATCAAMAVIGAAQTSWAQASCGLPASDTTAGYIVFPKVVADTSGRFTANTGSSVDTEIQLTNVSTSTRVLQCFLVDATGRCIDGTTPCATDADCAVSNGGPGGTCAGHWGEVDFQLTLTPHQPVGWRLSDGLIAGETPQRAASGDPLIGEIKCVEVVNSTGGLAVPINVNDLKGEATIETVMKGSPGSVDARSYNAVGFQTCVTNGQQQAEAPAAGEPPIVMCLGSSTLAGTDCPAAEYVSCPSTLVMDNFFDCTDPRNCPDGVSTKTDLTLVPCSETLVSGGNMTTTVAQFLVYNEFEQRFSTSTPVTCFKETDITAIDSPNDPNGSIFSLGVQGTLTGQTRIRGVPGNSPTVGRSLIGIAEIFRGQPVAIGTGGPGSSAVNLNYIGTGEANFVRY